VPNRACLKGILLVLKGACTCEYLLRQMGYGSGMTRWRRLGDWQGREVLVPIWTLLLDILGQAGAIDWTTGVVDGSSVRAVFMGAQNGPNPTDRVKAGSKKRHVLPTGWGTPLAIRQTAANVHNWQIAMPPVYAEPAFPQPAGRPRRRPDFLLADRAYDSEGKIRQPFRQRGIAPLFTDRHRDLAAAWGNTVTWWKPTCSGCSPGVACGSLQEKSRHSCRPAGPGVRHALLEKTQRGRWFLLELQYLW
jgi:hypothetical protein